MTVVPFGIKYPMYSSSCERLRKRIWTVQTCCDYLGRCMWYTYCENTSVCVVIQCKFYSLRGATGLQLGRHRVRELTSIELETTYRQVSLTTAVVYGRLTRSEKTGNRDRPTTRSISSWALRWMSGHAVKANIKTLDTDISWVAD